MGATLLIAIAAIVGYELWTQYAGAGCGCAPSGASFMSQSFCSDWMCSAAAAPYVSTLQQIGSQYNLPTNLLCAVAYEESSFNPSAVNELSGATGMFQLLPSYYPNAGQSWQNDAATAAQALSGYYTQFGDWTLALAAYNWGPTNVENWINAGQSAGNVPSETTSYVANISGAVGLSGQLA